MFLFNMNFRELSMNFQKLYISLWCVSEHDKDL